MKLGIITYHRAVNYGAVLQAYALNRYINELCIPSEIIDYRCDYIEDLYSLSKKHQHDNSLKQLIRYLLEYKFKKKCGARFQKFRKSELGLSDMSYNKDEIANTNSIYDLFLTGSDQVWNYACTNYDKAYFLDFVDDSCKKNSYAASFGFDEIPQEIKEEYSNLLGDFKNISVREDDGVRIVNELIFKNAVHTLDPTLLLTADEWASIIPKAPLKKNYILVYTFGLTENIINQAKALSKLTGLRILRISNGIYKNNSGIKYIRAVGPIEFLNLFKNASYIITNSYHGTLFSINFNKKFFLERLDEVNLNTRVNSILTLLCLKDRLIPGCDSDLLREINYEKVNEIIQQERIKSTNFLKEIIGETNE